VNKAVKADEPNYQALKVELESVMAKLQAEDLDVDEALSLYERGLELVQQLENYLKTAENSVQELKARFNKGNK
jgi:exodeoxyribonuclease VII small subunit